MTDEEVRPRAAVAAIERVRKVLRLIEFIVCFSKYSLFRNIAVIGHTNVPLSNGGTVVSGVGGVNIRGYLRKLRQCIIEEELVAFAEIAFFAEVVFVERRPVFHAAAATDCKVPADEAFITNILFGPGKGPLNAACGELFYRRIEDAAQLPSRLYEKVTAESIAIMFDNDVLTALFVERANRVFAGDEI